ncbi:MAG: mechanosensitive ion channel domain-containing protein [Cyanobacteria bacterium J06638_7]
MTPALAWDGLTRLFNAPLLPLGSQTITLGWLLGVGLLLLVVTLAARLLRFLLAKRLLLWLGLPEGRREAIGTLLAIGLAAFGYVAVAQGMGLDFGALAVLFGALGVGLGFGLQDLTRNLSSGLTLLMEGKLKVGDLIEFEGTQGFIREISFRSTVIRTFQGSEIVLPNALITNNLGLLLNPVNAPRLAQFSRLQWPSGPPWRPPPAGGCQRRGSGAALV